MKHCALPVLRMMYDTHKNYMLHALPLTHWCICIYIHLHVCEFARLYIQNIAIMYVVYGRPFEKGKACAVQSTQKTSDVLFNH